MPSKSYVRILERRILMNKFEQKKIKLNDVQVPQQLEQRLHNALAKQKQHRKKTPLIMLAAVALAFIFISFNINTFAYYGKKLFGYEQLMDETLAMLNDAGAGQTVNQSITLRDGTIVTIEGVLSDTNRFIVYYKAHNPVISLENGITLTELNGFLTKHFSSSTYELSSDQHTLTGIANFDAVNPFAKKLTISLFDGDHNSYEVSFRYNASEALATTLKHNINQKIKTDIGIFKLKKLTSTSASTLITGTFDKTTDRTFNIPRDFVLYADNKAIPIKQGSMSSSLFGNYSIDLLFDTIPANTKKLELKLQQFYSKDQIDVAIQLNPLPEAIVGPKNLEILNIDINDDATEIRIRSEQDVIFDEVSLQTSSGNVPLQTTKDFQESEGSFTRTLLFPTTDKVTELRIKNMYFIEAQNKTITIFN